MAALVAETDGKIVGFVVIDRDREGQGHVITIDVLPEARRSGLGSQLMTAAEEWSGSPEQANDMTVIVARLG